MLYRVEKRVADTQEAREYFGQRYAALREWQFVNNSNKTLKELLERYVDRDNYEFRIKKFKFEKDASTDTRMM